MPSTPLTEQVRHVLTKHFPAAAARRLGDSEDLLAGGVLDSLGVLDLVSHLERTFAVAVEDDDLLPEHFQSIASIAAFIEAKQRAGASRLAAAESDA